MALPPAQFSTLYYFFFRYSSHVQLHKQAGVCAYASSQGHFMFVCMCMRLGGMNPNEIFYGPVDLLIVPQVLSLLTPNLLETTCWAWFFSPSPLLLLVLFFILFFSPLPQGHLSLASCSSLKLKDTCFKGVSLIKICIYCNQGMVAVSSFCVQNAAFMVMVIRKSHIVCVCVYI